MALKYRSTAQYLKPDPRYKSKVISKFINCLMLHGKKSTAEKSFYNAMEILEQKFPGKDGEEIFKTAMSNVKPYIEVRSRRVGGANYQVPVEVSKTRQQSLAIRWILEATRSRRGKPASQCLAEEIADAYNKTGAAMTKRENVHKMAEANKAFAHFAWSR